MSFQKCVSQWTWNRIDLIIIPLLFLSCGKFSVSSLHDLPSSSSSSSSSSPWSSSVQEIGDVTLPTTYNMGEEPRRSEMITETPPITSSFSSPDAEVTTTTTTSDSDDDDEDEPWNEYAFGQLIKVPFSESTQANGSFIEYEWRIPNIYRLLELNVNFVRSPPFHLSKPGYRSQMVLFLNNTYTDGSSYLGLFFRLMTSSYDETLEWPYQLRTMLTLVDLQNFTSSIRHTITPNTDPCRLRSVFLRPSRQDDWTLSPDGCGSRRILSLLRLYTESTRFLRNGTLIVRGLFQLDNKGDNHETASIHLRYNNLVTKYIWRVKNFNTTFDKVSKEGQVNVLQSEPFYTHQGGYLVKLFLTMLPKDRAFAISLALMQGDYDRYLQWPFPYTLEVSIVDHSPEYWRKDYTISLTPSSADCTSSPFFQPSSYLDFCFTTIQSWNLLNLPHYRFIMDGSLDIQLTTKLNHFSGRKLASVGLYTGQLVAEFTWSIPNIRYKLSRFDYLGRSLKTFTSPEFYTNGQGYLLQMSLRLNSTGPSTGDIGLELTLVKGEYDNLLTWPFNQTYQLMIINQQSEYPDNDGLIAYNRTEIVSSTEEGNRMITVNPFNHKSHECSPASFVKPVERNPPCGKKRLISFTRINRSNDDNGSIKFGNFLVKARIFLSNQI